MSQPTVMFIDDSATMREVVKIAFRRENIEVIAFPDATSALTQMEQQTPDLVITDVIMPERDGYEVCQHIKQHPKLSATPVILMSGVVNRAVAEKAFAVKAAELIRKPFQPQDLITRVKHLLRPNEVPVPAPAAAAAAALSSIFSAPQAQRKPGSQVIAMPVPQPALPPAARPAVSAAVAREPQVPPVPTITRPHIGTVPADLGKLKIELMRLEGLVRKLQSELAAEREYSGALEEHLKTLQEAR